MKHLTLFLLAGIFFGSCTELVNYNEVVTITKRETADDKICYFRTSKYEDDMYRTYMWFYDYCSKYNIGDTIEISRK